MAARWLLPRAGRLTWNYFERGVSAEQKSDQTPVTIADREAEELLRSHIHEQFPDDGFLGEEFGQEPGTSGYQWIIDPIDATANFVRGVPIFANLVGLEYQGEMVAGFVYFPVRGQLYHAVRGGGAFRDDIPLRVANTARLEDAYLVYSSLRYHAKAGTTEAFLKLESRFPRSRGLGDFYGYLLVAEGSVDVMAEPILSPWDIAAVKPIVEEAGGVFSDWFGAPTIYGKGAITANPTLHRLVLQCIHGTT